MLRVDVLVVGAGLAGLEASRRLARKGLAVVLVDRKPDPARGIHTTGAFVRRTFEDFEFPQGTLGPPIRRVTLLSPRGRSIDLESDTDQFRIGRMEALYGFLLEDGLAAGARWLPGRRFVGLETTATGTVATLIAGGRVEAIEAGMVLGADGARSAVAESLGLDRNREWIAGVEEVWRGVPNDGRGRFSCWIDPVHAPGYLGWLIQDGDEIHVGTGGYRDRFDPGASLAVLRARARERVDLTRAELIERRGGLIPVGGVLRRIGSERGLLIGDAAGAPSPLTAGGLDPCLRLAALAADLVARRLGGETGALAGYDGARFRRRFGKRLLLRRLFGRLRSPAATELAFRLVDTPPGRRLARRIFFGRGSFPDVGVPLSLPEPAAPGCV